MAGIQFQKWWGILLLVFFFVITVPIAIIQSKVDKKKKIAMWIGYAFLVFLGIIGQTAGNGTNGEKAAETKKETIVEEKNVNKAEENIKTALKEIGIEKDYKIERDESLDGLAEENTKGYRVKTEFSQQGIPVYVNADETVYSIRYADKDYYLKGKVIDNIKSDTMTRSEMYNYKNQLEERIKSILKSPATAKFPNISDWNFSKKSNVVTIQSYVDSQNSFGALLRAEFKVQYDEKKGEFTSFVFDGEELIK